MGVILVKAKMPKGKSTERWEQCFAWGSCKRPRSVGKLGKRKLSERIIDRNSMRALGVGGGLNKLCVRNNVIEQGITHGSVDTVKMAKHDSACLIGSPEYDPCRSLAR